MRHISKIFLFSLLCIYFFDNFAMDSVTGTSINTEESSLAATKALESLILKKCYRGYTVEDLNKIKELIDAGADVDKPLEIHGGSDITTSNGIAKQYTPLVIAALFDQYELAKVLIEDGADVNNTQSDRYVAIPDYVDSTMATRAIDWAWDERICALLLDADTDVNYRGSLGYTAIHRVVEMAPIKCIDAIYRKLYLLMRYSADIREKNWIEQDAIDLMEPLVMATDKRNKVISFFKGEEEFTRYCKEQMKDFDSGKNIVASIHRQQIYGPLYKTHGQRLRPIQGPKEVKASSSNQ